MINLYLDFDGVIADTIKVTYKMIEDAGININDYSRVCEFYKNLNWFDLLNNVNQINNSIQYIKQLENAGVYNLFILTTVNSLEEIKAKNEYIRQFGIMAPIISVPSGLKKSDWVNAQNNILVDDYSRNLIAWELSGGIGIKFSDKNCSEFITINSLNELNAEQFVKKLKKR